VLFHIGQLSSMSNASRLWRRYFESQLFVLGLIGFFERCGLTILHVSNFYFTSTNLIITLNHKRARNGRAQFCATIDNRRIRTRSQTSGSKFCPATSRRRNDLVTTCVTALERRIGLGIGLNELVRETGCGRVRVVRIQSRKTSDQNR
jgi:hypothetical protein